MIVFLLILIVLILSDLRRWFWANVAIAAALTLALRAGGVGAAGLSIPSINTHVDTITTASYPLWKQKQWDELAWQMERLLEHGCVRYPHADIIGCHNYREFGRLHEVSRGDRIWRDGVEYVIYRKARMAATRVRVLYSNAPLLLITCVDNDISRRWVVFARPV